MSQASKNSSLWGNLNNGFLCSFLWEPIVADEEQL